RISTGAWDHVYSLSNDLPSASLATMAAITTPVGFYIFNGAITPSNEAARTWLEMAAFDRLKQLNTRSYQQLMLDIIGYPDAIPSPPALDIKDSLKAAALTRLSNLFPGSQRK